jgi:hypothetical protein
MTLNPIEGFKHFETDHCVTGSMRHIYAFHGHDLSEDLLLGLGEGVGFAYFRFRGQPPFMGGRAMPKPSMEEIAARRTGVRIKARKSSSDPAAEKVLVAGIESGAPVMLQVDMGFLPYFDFGGQEYHFGGHVVVACGLDRASGEVLIADREKDLHPVPMAALARARGSRYRPFPPGRKWWEFDFGAFKPPSKQDILLAIRKQASFMLSPPIANLGVKGIRKAAGEVARWDALLAPEELRGALFNIWIFASAVGGTGGGLFRRMFSRFLGEASERTGRKQLASSGAEFGSIAEAWDAVAVLARQAADERTPPLHAAYLPRLSSAIAAIADSEEKAWKALVRGASAG